MHCVLNLKKVLQHYKVNVVAGIHENDHLRIFSRLIPNSCHHLYRKYHDSFGSSNVVFFHTQSDFAYFENKQGQINSLKETTNNDEIITYYFPIKRLRGSQNRVYILPAPTVLEVNEGVDLFFNVEHWLNGKPIEALIWVDSSPYAQSTEILFLQKLYQHHKSFWANTHFHICFYENMKATLLDISGVDDAIEQATLHYQDNIEPRAIYHRLSPDTVETDLEAVLNHQTLHLELVQNSIKGEVETCMSNFKYFTEDYQTDILDEIDFLTVFDKALKLPALFDVNMARLFCHTAIKRISSHCHEHILPLIEAFVTSNFIKPSIDLGNITTELAQLFDQQWTSLESKLNVIIIKSISVNSLNRIELQSALRLNSKKAIEVFFKQTLASELENFIKRKHQVWQPLLATK
jgi:hypothetical protein